MRIVVCVKQAGALGDEVEFGADGRSVADDYLDFSLNEWDGYAVEEALRLRERHGGEGDEVVVVSAGDERADAALRRCLAMGADRAVRVAVALDGVDAVAVAGALAPAVAAEQPDLVLCGVQSSDFGQGATGSALAALLDLPCVAVVTAVDWNPAGHRALVDRELEGGVIDVVEVDTPAVLTIQTGINQPRYATLRAIKQAERQPVAIVEPDAVAESAASVRRLFVPPRNGGAVLIDGRPAEVARRIADIVAELLA